MLYSYQGKEPQELPERIKFPDGRTHYLAENSLTDEELELAGWIGPIAQPPYQQGTEKRVWDSETLSYQVQPLTDAEKEALWVTKQASNSQQIAELRAIAHIRREQLIELGVGVEAIDSFLTLLGAAELNSTNPFELRLPSVSLLGVAPGIVSLEDPFTEWLKANYESNLEHGYKVVINELEVTDAALFEAHKQAVTNTFLQEYLSTSFTALAFVASFNDNFNGTGELQIAVMGDADGARITSDGEELSLAENKALLKGRGSHTVEVTPLLANEPCGRTEKTEITLI
jgi:hypothetical protein